jgi:hypothetical protein
VSAFFSTKSLRLVVEPQIAVDLRIKMQIFVELVVEADARSASAKFELLGACLKA